jgi:hypothetical protein
MKQAIRENRRGKVRVAESLIFDNFPGVALLRSRMEVCEEPHDGYTRSVWFIGYAPEFEPLVVGERPPEYEAIFTLTQGGHGVDLIFRPASQDRRIQEFKEDSDEWLRRIIEFAAWPAASRSDPDLRQ